MNRATLVETLELVQPALAEPNSPVPMFQNLIFEGGQVYAYNDNLGILGPCDDQGVFAVHGKTLIGVLKNSRAEEVTFELDGNDLKVKAGKTTAKMPIFKKEEFLFEEPPAKYPAKVPLNEKSIMGIDVCLTTVSRDQSLPALMGVTLTHDGKKARLYSCDGDAITRYGLTDTTVKKEGTFTIPTSFCEALIRTSQKAGIADGILEISDEWAKATLGDFTIYGRMIQNDNPLDHAKLIADSMKQKPSYVPLPKGMDDALSRARVVSDPESAPTKLTVKDGKLIMLTETHMGVVRDSMVVRGAHPDTEATVNASAVQRAIKICDEIALFENCTVYRQGDALLQVLSNMGNT